MVNEYLGAAAGAALGFVHGDVPGAVAGWNLGRKAARADFGRRIVKYGNDYFYPKRKMAPIPPQESPGNMFQTPRKRVASSGDLFTRSSKRSGTPRYSSVVKKVGGRRYRPKTRGRSVRKTPKSENINTGNATRKKSVKKNKKAVRISPKFRKAVKQALTAKSLKGVHTNRGFNKFDLPKSNQQQWQHIIWNGSTGNGVMFSPIQVGDAAAQLWKKKAPNVDPFLNRNLNFSEINSIINVVNSYTVAEFANMTHRTVWITIYECIFKASRNAADVAGAPQQWEKCLADDAVAFIALDGANGYDGTSTASVKKLGATPGQTSSFSQFFKYTSRNVVLEPGQRFVHHIQGPKNTVYDYSKFAGELSFNNNAAGKTMSCFAVMHSDLVTDDVASGAGRYKITGTGADVSGHYIAMDVKTTFVLELPEQAGFEYPVATTAGSQQDLTRRKRAYLDNVWIFGADPASTAVHRIDSNQPATDTHT